MFMPRKCLDCGDLLQGRADKKFCSDQCRNSYNNRNNCNSTNLMRNVNNALRRNRRILADLNPEGKITIHRERLLESGFNFKYLTHTYTTRKGDKYFFVYDMGYLPLKNDFYMLVTRKQEEKPAPPQIVSSDGWQVAGEE